MTWREEGEIIKMANKRLSTAFIWPYTFIPQDLECGALELTNVKRISLPLQMCESRNVKGV